MISWYPVGTTYSVAAPSPHPTAVLAQTNRWLTAFCAVSAIGSGVFVTFTLGVPVIPTFHVPLCVAATVPEILPVPCRVTGKGVLTTVTGADPALSTGLT